MNKILITGYSGNIGGSIAKYFNKLNINYTIGVRCPSKLNNLPNNINKVQLDLENHSTYPEALKGIKRVFLIRPPHISDVNGVFKPFIDYCKSVDIEHIVFLSLLGIEKNPFPPHYKIEKLIIDSEINYTFIRPSFFMQNLIEPHSIDIIERDEIFIPSGSARISFIDTEDIGEIIGKVLTEDSHYNKNYTITGSEAISYNTVAKIMSDILCRKITYTNPSLFKFRKEIIARGTKKEFANIMTLLYLTTKLGMAKTVTNTAEELLGRKPRKLIDFITDNQHIWSGNSKL